MLPEFGALALSVVKAAYRDGRRLTSNERELAEAGFVPATVQP